MFNERLELERYKISCLRPRPKQCIGCACHPKGPGFDPLMTGAFVPPSGQLSAPLLCVGISGGEEEEVRGEALVGPSGRKLSRALAYFSKSIGLSKTIEVR